MSVLQNNVTAYGSKPTGLLSVFNPPIISNRNPTGSDKAPLGTLWVNKVLNSVYVLASVVANNAAWLDIAGGGGAFATLQVNPGGLSVGPAAPGAAGTIIANTTITAGTGITSTTGNIVATAGQVNAGTTMTAGTGITATTGNIVATAGQVNAGTTMTAGTGITATTGNIVATAGQVNAGTTITAGTGISATIGNIAALGGDFIAIDALADASGATLTFEKNRAAGIVHAGDSLGSIVIAGWDGTQYVDGAVISGAVVGTPGVNRVGTNLLFATHPDSVSGGTNATLRAELTSTGALELFKPDDSGAGGPSLNTINNANANEANEIRWSKNRAGGVIGLDDDLGYLSWYGFDGANYIKAAGITVTNDGVLGAGQVPADMIFATAPNAAGPAQPRMTLDLNGVLTINNPDAPAGGISLVTTTSAAQFGTYIQIGGFAGPQLISGAGDPNVALLVAPVGSLYLNSTPTVATDRMFINTDGAHNWVFFTASA